MAQVKFYQLDMENKDQAINQISQLDSIYETNEAVIEALESDWDVDDEYNFILDEYEAVTVVQKKTGKKVY